jgi:hypothetical protein
VIDAITPPAVVLLVQTRQSAARYHAEVSGSWQHVSGGRPAPLLLQFHPRRRARQGRDVRQMTDVQWAVREIGADEDIPEPAECAEVDESAVDDEEDAGDGTAQ